VETWGVGLPVNGDDCIRAPAEPNYVDSLTMNPMQAPRSEGTPVGKRRREALPFENSDG